MYTLETIQQKWIRSHECVIIERFTDKEETQLLVITQAGKSYYQYFFFPVGGNYECSVDASETDIDTLLIAVTNRLLN